MLQENDLTFGDAFKVELLEHLGLSLRAPLTVHNLGNYGTSVASGSYRTMGMAVVPCSLGTLGANCQWANRKSHS